MGLVIMNTIRVGVFITGLIATYANGQVKFVGLKPVYELPNRTPADELVATFQATEKRGKARFAYDLFDSAATPFRLDRQTGKLMTTAEIHRKIGDIVRVTIAATNLDTKSNIREVIKIKITQAVNRYSPAFPSDGSTVLIPKDSRRSQTVWIADAEDADPDEPNNDILYGDASMDPSGYLLFVTDTGELKLEKPWNELPEAGIKVTLKACNRDSAEPKRCGFGVFLVRPDLPSMDSLLGLLDNIDASKLAAVSDAVENMAEFAKTDVKVAANMLTVVSAVMHLDGKKLSAAMPEHVSKKIRSSISSYTEGAILKDVQPIRLRSGNVEVNVLDILDVSLSNAVVFRSISDATTSEAGSHAASGIQFSIPTQTLPDVTDMSSPLRIAFVLYMNAKLFSDASTLPQNPGNSPGTVAITNVTSLDAPVIVAAIKNCSNDNLTVPVDFRIGKPGLGKPYKCVYWDESGNTWSSVGVEAVAQTDDYVECRASHMTAFSILFDPMPGEGVHDDHELILSVISYTGCGLSVFGALATVITYSLFRQLRTDRSGKILINLCFAIAGLNLTFAAASLANIAPFQFSCSLASVFIHIFTLSTFVWMGVEASNMYQMLIQVFYTNQEMHFLMKRMMLGWGLPAFIAMMTIIMESYNAHDNALFNKRCRLTPKNLFVYYTAFFAPLAVIIIANTAIFIKVVSVICEPRPDFAKVKGRPTAKSLQVGRNQVHGSVALMFLLGITWIFGAMAFSHGRLVFQYIFCILNSFQGFMIFIFRCVERREARAAWLRFCKTGDRRPVSATPPTSTSRSNLLSVNMANDVRQTGRDLSSHFIREQRPLLEKSVTTDSKSLKMDTLKVPT